MIRQVAFFPSDAWFNAVRKEFNNDEDFHLHGAGQCNCIAGVKVDDDIYVLTFEGQECTSAVKAAETKLTEVDFYMSMEADEWQKMLANIQENGHAVGEFTLNTLDLNRPDGLSTSAHGDQYREDMFFRYNQTLQFFFDASSKVDTRFH